MVKFVLPRAHLYVSIYLYICVRPDDRTVPTLYVACAARAIERNEPPSDKLGGEICIATRELVCIYLYNILGLCSFQHKWASERQLYLFVLLHHVIMK